MCNSYLNTHFVTIIKVTYNEGALSITYILHLAHIIASTREERLFNLKTSCKAHNGRPAAHMRRARADSLLKHLKHLSLLIFNEGSHRSHNLIFDA
jgi:hypothetical protein